MRPRGTVLVGFSAHGSGFRAHCLEFMVLGSSGKVEASGFSVELAGSTRCGSGSSLNGRRRSRSRVSCAGRVQGFRTRLGGGLRESRRVRGEKRFGLSESWQVIGRELAGSYLRIIEVYDSTLGLRVTIKSWRVIRDLLAPGVLAGEGHENGLALALAHDEHRHEAESEHRHDTLSVGVRLQGYLTFSSLGIGLR